ncbi:MAG: glycosyltransferase family 2 protein [candidate division Zixibacteria bacterium]|nr:glycosyltransferase family 2 protein [candidate division Zixibacteria bacterium]
MISRIPEISAIVIVYNGIEFLPDCLRTLTDDLRFTSYELILVDNGSADGSVEYLETHYPLARLVENGTNLGFAKAVNIGMEMARGEYLYILNQDLRFRSDATRTLLERLKTEPALGMIGPGYVYFDGRPHKSARALPTYRHVFYRALFLDRTFPHHREFSHWRMGWFDHKDEMYVDQPMGAVMLIPRGMVKKIGYMDESFPILFNDVDYCRRLKDHGYRLLYYPKATVEHHVGASTSKRPYRMKIISHFSMYRYLKKYARWYEYPVLWACGVLLLIGLAISLVGGFVRRKFISTRSFSS